jgi:hypothetical protein
MRMKKKELNLKSFLIWGRVSGYGGQWWFSEKEQRQSSGNTNSWLQKNIFERDALLGERYVKLFLIVSIVRIWFPKRW